MPITLSNLSYATFLSLDYGKSNGSGFKLNLDDRSYIITAKHVLYDEADNLRCQSILATSQNSRGEEIDAQSIVIDSLQAKIFKSLTNDVAVIVMEDVDYFHIQQVGRNITSVNSEDTLRLEEIGIANEVFLIGFPTSLIVPGAMYFDVNRPLLRKGIVAGINRNDNTFIIDCSSYYGNSGSPVLEKREDGSFKLIGLVSKYIPFVTEWKNNREASISHTEFSNSGYSVCIPMDEVFSLIDTI